MKNKQILPQLKETRTSIIINHADIAHTAVTSAQFPTDNLPEIAFAGRSNVGKSSLINAMLGRKKLARTSQTPGKTRTINFFIVENKLYFVDLPGYGYAKVSKTEQEKWAPMVNNYLKNRPPLKHIFLLMDIRHEPTNHDHMIYDWVQHYSLPHTIVATKADKLSRNQQAKHLSTMRKALGIKNLYTAEAPGGEDSSPLPGASGLLAFSAETRTGRDELWQVILDSLGIDML